MGSDQKAYASALTYIAACAKEKAEQIAAAKSRRNVLPEDAWLVAILQELNFPDEVRSSDIMVDDKVANLSRLTSAMERQGYLLHSRGRPNKGGRLLHIWCK